jgi:hypothetical protein
VSCVIQLMALGVDWGPAFVTTDEPSLVRIEHLLAYIGPFNERRFSKNILLKGCTLENDALPRSTCKPIGYFGLAKSRHSSASSQRR